jgi:uncharacterized repeat protein (TIGR04076 family)
MAKVRITVVKKTLNKDLARKYCARKVGPCECFKVGDEFIAGLEKPKGFCDWAWNDISRSQVALLTGGSFSNLFPGWMKDGKTIITCCTDGIRPVIFKIETIADGPGRKRPPRRRPGGRLKPGKDASG